MCIGEIKSHLHWRHRPGRPSHVAEVQNLENLHYCPVQINVYVDCNNKDIDSFFFIQTLSEIKGLMLQSQTNKIKPVALLGEILFQNNF